MSFDLFLYNILLVSVKCKCEELSPKECDSNPYCVFNSYEDICERIPCDVRCLTCDEYNPTLCLSCINGYYLDQNDESHTYQKCVRDLVHCDENCQTCNSLGSCTKCKIGYGKTKMNKCQKCKMDHCYDCNQDYETCSECEIGYGYDNDKYSETYHQCVKCETKNCIHCTSSKECIECADSYGIDENENSQTYGECIPCKNRYCLTCNINADKCIECKEGYGIDYSQRDSPTYEKCIPCTDKNCSDCGFNADICNECKEEYFFSDKKCIEKKCAAYCEECSDNEHSCKRCKIGYGRKIDLVSHEEIPGCTKCANENMNLCIDAELLYGSQCICHKCIDGYYVGSLNEWQTLIFGKCLQCNISNCKKCDTHSTYCEECMDGYGLDIFVNSENYGKCVPCQKPNCKSCSVQYTQCDICKDGFALDNSGSCVQDKNENDPNNPNGPNDNNGGGNNDGKMSKTTLIIIIVVVVVVVIALIVSLTVFFVIRKKRKNLEKSSNEGNIENNE